MFEISRAAVPRGPEAVPLIARIGQHLLHAIAARHRCYPPVGNQTWQAIVTDAPGTRPAGGYSCPECGQQWSANPTPQT